MSHPAYAPSPPDVRVSVEVSYLAAHSAPGRHLFAYVVRIENHSGDTWQLLARHWDIVDGAGRHTVVDGEGVVGERPVLAPGGVFVYDSLVTLEDPPGQMSGHYVMQDAWGVRARVPIPAFGLVGEVGGRTLN